MLVRVFYNQDTDKVSTTCLCSISNEMFTVTVPLNDWVNWKIGWSSIQEAFPYLTPDEREMIQTGTTPKEWDAWFKPPED